MGSRTGFSKNMFIVGIILWGLLKILNMPGLSMAAEKKLFFKTPQQIQQYNPTIKETEKPKLLSIRISGKIMYPNGQGIGVGEVKLYELKEGRFVYVMKAKCARSNGIYTIKLEEKWLNKSVKLAPQIETIEAKYFLPPERFLKITDHNISNINFAYPKELHILD